MTHNEEPVLNPNTADEEALRQLPGVGPKLAGRIIEGRPYRNIEDLRAVPGLGDSVLEDIQPFLTFEAPKSGKRPADTDLGSAQFDRVAGMQQKYPLVLSEPQPKGTGIWAMLAVGAASVLCSVTLSLSVLTGINGTLDIGRHAALQETSSELLQIRSQLESTQVEIEALRGRAAALEGMTGRMAEVESQVAELQQRVGETIVVVDEMEAELTAALVETRAQAERVNRFQTFLDGLARLISQVTADP